VAAATNRAPHRAEDLEDDADDYQNNANSPQDRELVCEKGNDKQEDA
jgi:hypothetical protein